MMRHWRNKSLLFSLSLLVGSLSLTVLTGCSGIPRHESDQEQLDRYLRYAGPPVDRVTYLGHYDSWQAVAKYQLVLWTTINDAYLITVASPCENLQFAQRIAVTTTSSTLYARFDAVVVKGWRCMIMEIRPIDYLRMRKDLREERERSKAEGATQKP
jgi:hypothetical protein